MVLKLKSNNRRLVTVLKNLFSLVSLFLIAASLTACGTKPEADEAPNRSQAIGSQKQEAIKTDMAPEAIGPYSQGIKTGNLIFTSGQIGIDPATGEIVSGGIEEQAIQVFENLNAVLSASGASMSDVVKTTVFIKDMNDFSKVNEIYGKYFSQPYPARSCVEVSRLPKDVLIEVEAIALVK